MTDQFPTSLSRGRRLVNIAYALFFGSLLLPWFVGGTRIISHPPNPIFKIYAFGYDVFVELFINSFDFREMLPSFAVLSVLCFLVSMLLDKLIRSHKAWLFACVCCFLGFVMAPCIASVGVPTERLIHYWYPHFGPFIWWSSFLIAGIGFRRLSRKPTAESWDVDSV